MPAALALVLAPTSPSDKDWLSRTAEPSTFVAGARGIATSGLEAGVTEFTVVATGIFAIVGAAAAPLEDMTELTADTRWLGRERNWPFHFFSSHSTQSIRPAETGNPQATHFRKSLNTGGT